MTADQSQLRHTFGPDTLFRMWGIRRIAIWAVSSAIALLVGTATGTALAVAIVHGGPLVWVESIQMLTQPPLQLGETDGTWMLAIEWKMAFFWACCIALVGFALWMVAEWRRTTGYKMALALGFVLTAIAAAVVFQNADSSGPASFVFLYFVFGCAGAASGCITFGMDRAIRRIFHWLLVGKGGP